MEGSGSKTPAVGIDLGTTYSCVGVWHHNGVEIVANEQGNKTTPSCVAFTEDERLVGEGAKNQVARNPANTIFDAKRLIGRRVSDATVQADMKLWPFKIIPGPDDKPQIVVTYKGEKKQFVAEEISSMVLAKMKEIAELYLCTQVTSAVITVPAYFNDSQRQATKDAATIAGIEAARIINEPTAAALAYGLHKKADIAGQINVLIFDLGGGTFDVSVITISEGGIFTVKACGGDTHLGGEDFDNRIIEYFVEEFDRKHGLDVSGNPKALGRLRAACERAKRIVSSTTFCPIEIDCFYAGVDYATKLARAKFEQLNMDLFKKCIQKVSMCLSDAKVSIEDIHDVVLVGGSTRIPKIQEMLQEFFGRKDLCRTINPDEAVAYGATVLAEMLKGSGKSNETVKELQLFDVTPLSLGIKTTGNVMGVMIPRNTPIPTKKEHNFTTTTNNQSSILFEVFQGERTRPNDNYKLGEFLLSGIRRAPRGKPTITCSFEVDTDGILNVSAMDLRSGKGKKVTIGNDKLSLPKEEIEKMIQDAETFKVDDQDHKERANALIDLKDYVYFTRKKIKTADAETKMEPEDLKKMKDEIQETDKWIQENKEAKAKEFVAKLEKLQELFKPIWARLRIRKRQRNEPQIKTQSYQSV